MPGAPPPLSAVLDAEFLFLLSLLRPIFAALSSEYREQARLWLERLCWVPALVDSARRDRNEYLSRLYYGMMSDSLDAVFLDVPPEGALRPPRDVFPDVDLTSWLHGAEASGTQPAGGGLGRGDADERTYLATSLLPGGRGAFGYLAVSLAKEGAQHWVPGAGATGGGSPNRWQRGDPQATSSPLSDDQPQPPPGLPAPQGTPGPIDDLVASRPSAAQRQHLMDFYDSLIEDLDQAMAEPDKTSPELEKLISTFQDPSATADSAAPLGEEASAHQMELLAQLRERLQERRERAAERSALLDSLERDVGAAGASPPWPSPAPARPTRPRRDEDDVWSIRPDNVAMLSAAYPPQLVDRFLDAVVRERVSVLGRVRARRYWKRHVEGVEEDAGEDMEHYRDATAAWAGVLRDSGADFGSSLDTAEQADLCAAAADKAMKDIRELGAARQEFFDREADMRQEQERLRAEIAVLRAEDSQLKRQSEGADTAAAGK